MEKISNIWETAIVQVKLLYYSFFHFSYCLILRMFFCKRSKKQSIKQKKITNSLPWSLHVFGRTTKSWPRQKKPPELFFKKKKTYSFSKKRLWCRCFPVNFEKFFKNTCFTEHLRASASAKVRVPIATP